MNPTRASDLLWIGPLLGENQTNPPRGGVSKLVHGRDVNRPVLGWWGGATVDEWAASIHHRMCKNPLQLSTTSFTRNDHIVWCQTCLFKDSRRPCCDHFLRFLAFWAEKDRHVMDGPCRLNIPHAESLLTETHDHWGATKERQQKELNRFECASHPAVFEGVPPHYPKPQPPCTAFANTIHRPCAGPQDIMVLASIWEKQQNPHRE